MRFIARFAMRGPLFAAATAAAFLLASLAVGLLVIVSGAVVALATLRQGGLEGLRVMALGAGMAAAARLALAGDAVPMLVLCAVVWLPAWLMAQSLARRRRQAYPLMLAGLLVAVYALSMRLLVGDVARFWAERLTPLFDALTRDAGTRFTPEQVAFVAGQVHAWSLVAFEVMLAGMLLLGRWWQAELYNPGGFGSEFRELALPRRLVLALGAAAVLVLVDGAVAPNLAFAGDVCVILVVLFAFQGLAVVHFRARVMGLAKGWLVALYVALTLLPQVVGAILASAGMVDGLADFRGLGRARVERPPEP